MDEMGSVSFDAADRLAIINLFGAFADTYDDLRFDEFRALFADGAEVRWQHEDRILFEGLDIAIASAQARLEAFKNQGTNAATTSPRSRSQPRAQPKPRDTPTPRCSVRPMAVHQPST